MGRREGGGFATRVVQCGNCTVRSCAEGAIGTTPGVSPNQRRLTHTCTQTDGAANDKAAHDAPDKKWWKARSKPCRIIDSLDLFTRFVDVPLVKLAAKAVARTL